MAYKKKFYRHDCMSSLIGYCDSFISIYIVDIYIIIYTHLFMRQDDPVPPFLPNVKFQVFRDIIKLPLAKPRKPPKRSDKRTVTGKKSKQD